jgi:hypothetical protein
MAADPLTAATVDNLFNYDDTDDEDLFADKRPTATRDDKPTLSPRHTKRKTGDHDGDDLLGLDEEVKIVKKRKPIAKLDEARQVDLILSLGYFTKHGCIDSFQHPAYQSYAIWHAQVRSERSYG